MLPPVAERSLSGLVLGHNDTGIHVATSSSDEWHQALKVEGFRRLTQSPVTELFGYGIRPSPDLYEVKSFMEDPKAVVELAANTGSYESGFWCVLALLGVVGFSLYTFLFIYLWKQTFPYLVRRPIGTFWEGILFWGCYISVIWYVSSYFAGGFPSMELFLMILAMDVVQDGRLEQEPALVPLAGRPVTPMHSLRRTGETIARAIVVGWGGKIHLLGLRGRDQVIPVFLPQHKMSFWKRSIGFTVHPRPDFPRERGEGPSS